MRGPALRINKETHYALKDIDGRADMCAQRMDVGERKKMTVTAVVTWDTPTRATGTKAEN